MEIFSRKVCNLRQKLNKKGKGERKKGKDEIKYELSKKHIFLQPSTFKLPTFQPSTLKSCSPPKVHFMNIKWVGVYHLMPLAMLGVKLMMNCTRHCLGMSFAMF
jgi:hypothetical protein